MSTSYESVLERLKEERLRKQWTQYEMGRILRMNQSHYIKVEHGRRRFTYYETQYLCEADIDSYYIFTGKYCKAKYNDFWEQCSYKELICFLDLVYTTIEYFNMLKVNERWKSINEEIKYAKCAIIKGKKDGNVFYKLRQTLEYRQQRMAEIIGVDVKKLRELENGKILPDSEMIWKMYHLFNIPPALMVKSKKELINTINYFFDIMDTENEKIIFEFLRRCHEIK